MTQRIRRCSSQKELEKVVDDFITVGYKVKSRGESSVVLEKFKPKKHGTVFLWTFWWTAGIGNLIYALIPPTLEDEVCVKIDDTI